MRFTEETASEYENVAMKCGRSLHIYDNPDPVALIRHWIDSVPCKVFDIWYMFISNVRSESI